MTTSYDFSVHNAFGRVTDVRNQDPSPYVTRASEFCGLNIGVYLWVWSVVWLCRVTGVGHCMLPVLIIKYVYTPGRMHTHTCVRTHTLTYTYSTDHEVPAARNVHIWTRAHTRTHTYSTDYEIPGCQELAQCLQQTNLVDLHQCAEDVLHGNIHTVIGGFWDCKYLVEIKQQGYLLSKIKTQFISLRIL